MGTIEQLTATHMALDQQLSRLLRVLDVLLRAEGDGEALEWLLDGLSKLKARLDAHLSKEAELGVRSERVLGRGILEEFDVVSLHDALRESLFEMENASSGERAAEVLAKRLPEFAALFRAHTENEIRFISTHANVLFPGGSVG